MGPTLRTVLACIAGFVVGSGVNMAIVVVGPWVVPPPSGVDASDAEALRQSIHLLEPRHFAAPFLAHALGTLAGSFVAFRLAAVRRRAVAYGVGALFLAGGAATATLIPAPWWFVVIDLGAAYLPMAHLGVRLGERIGAPPAGSIEQDAP